MSSGTELDNEENPVTLAKYLVAGGAGGVCTVLVGHPFDTIKVRLQTMPKHGSGEEPMYKGAFDCAKKTIQNEGIRGLYKGMTAPITIVSPIFSIRFLGFGLGKKLIENYPKEKLPPLKTLAAGSFAGIFTTTIMTPGERIKCLLQVQQTSGSTPTYRYTGPKDALKKVYREGGIRSLYRGTTATLLRDIPATGMYFMTYEAAQHFLTPPGSSDLGIGRTILSGGAAGLAYWSVAIPADVMKSRQQAAPEGMYPGGLPDVFRTLWKESGAKGFFKGSVPVFMRAFPANAACFFGFELTMKCLHWIGNHL